MVAMSPKLMAEYSNSSITSSEVIKVAAPLLLGPLFNWALYGALCVQIYVYSYNFPDDTRLIKFLAYFTFLAETVQTALTGCDIYYWFVTGFGQPERLGHSHFVPFDVPIMISVSSPIVQGYFCYRIWVLKKGLGSSWFCWVIAILAATQTVAGVWAGLRSLISGKYAVTKTAMGLWSIPSALADIMIAVAMTLMLRMSGSNYSNFVLVRVVRLTVETNALTATMAFVIMVLYFAFPDQLYYMYLSEIIGKLYSNTLLVSLNNRIYFRDRASSARDSGLDNSTNLPVSVWVRATSVTSPPSAITGPPPPPRAPNGVFTLSTDSKPRTLPHPQKSRTFPEDPGEWIVDTASSNHSNQTEMA